MSSSCSTQAARVWTPLVPARLERMNMDLAFAFSWRSMAASHGLLTDLLTNAPEHAGTKLVAMDLDRLETAGQPDSVVRGGTR